MVSRLLMSVAVGLAAANLATAPRAWASPPDEAEPTDTPAGDPEPVDDDGLPEAMGPLVVVPAGCALPQAAEVVFEGLIIAANSTTARFEVQRVLAGSLDGRERAPGVIDVQYGEEVRFLEVGMAYIVGAGADDATGTLGSKVRDPAPLFGGDAVIGMNDSDVDCPRVEDPIRTLLPDGTSVESGVFTPLDGKGDALLRAVFLPLGVALAILIGLVLLKQLMFAVGRSLRDLGDPPPTPQRVRRHLRLD